LARSDLVREAAWALINGIARPKWKGTVFVICGLHNRWFAEALMLASHRVGAEPHVWVFDEDSFAKNLEAASEKAVPMVPVVERSLLERSDVVFWLSQFDSLERFPEEVRGIDCAFWDGVHESLKAKPRLLVNLPSARFVRDMGIDYDRFVRVFVDGVMVDYEKLGWSGLRVASRLDDKFVQVYDVNGTYLEFSLKGRSAGVEAVVPGGSGEVDIPSGEVYVAPVEDSANGVLVVDKLREHGVRRLRLDFSRGRIVDIHADEGLDEFLSLLKGAEGGKDVLAEFGIGMNCGMKPVGWSVYDEKALGTVHVAIGNNMHMGGVNKASIHVDFVLYDPTVKVDERVVMQRGELVGV